MGTKWTAERREKYKRTMAARRKNGMKRSSPVEGPKTILAYIDGRLIQLRRETIGVFVPE